MTCKELLEDIATFVETSAIIKKAAGWPEIDSVKKGTGGNFQLTWLFNEDY